MKLTKAQEHVLLHSLGLTRKPESYRNYFCAGEGHADMPVIRELMDAGYMAAARTINEGRDTIFVVTDSGRAALQEGK